MPSPAFELSGQFTADVTGLLRSAKAAADQLKAIGASGQQGANLAAQAIGNVEKAVAATTQQISALNAAVKAQGAAAVGAAKQTEDATKRASDATRQHSNEMRRATSATKEWNAATAAAAAGAAAITASMAAFVVKAAHAGIAYNTLEQQSRSAFRVILGGAEAANAMMGKVAEFARSSPFPRQAFISATQQLLAFGFEAENVVETLQGIENAVAAIGGNAHQIAEITSILSDVQSTGRLGIETLNMLGIRGVNAAKLIAEQMGKTEAEFRNSVFGSPLQGGEAFKALDALIKGMNEEFAGAASGLKATWTGAQDRIAGAIRDTGSAIVEPFISKEGGGLAVELANSVADGLRAVEAVVKPAMEALTPYIEGPFRKIDELIDRVAAKGKDGRFGEKVAGAIDQIMQHPMLVGAGAGGALGAGMSGARSLLAATPLGNLAPMLAPLNAWQGALAGAVLANKELRASIGELAGDIVKALGTLAEAMAPFIAVIEDLVADNAGSLGKIITGVGEGIQNIAQGVANVAPIAAAGLRMLLAAAQPLISLAGKLAENETLMTALVAAFAASKLMQRASEVDMLSKAFGGLAGSVGSVLDKFGDGSLGESFGGLVEGLKGNRKMIAAGVGGALAGGAVGLSASSQGSAIGGGALSGAAVGMAAGPYGAAVGAVAGGVIASVTQAFKAQGDEAAKARMEVREHYQQIRETRGPVAALDELTAAQRRLNEEGEKSGWMDSVKSKLGGWSEALLDSPIVGSGLKFAPGMSIIGAQMQGLADSTESARDAANEAKALEEEFLAIAEVSRGDLSDALGAADEHLKALERDAKVAAEELASMAGTDVAGLSSELGLTAAQIKQMAQMAPELQQSLKKWQEAATQAGAALQSIAAGRDEPEGPLGKYLAKERAASTDLADFYRKQALDVRQARMLVQDMLEAGADPKTIQEVVQGGPEAIQEMWRLMSATHAQGGQEAVAAAVQAGEGQRDALVDLFTALGRDTTRAMALASGGEGLGGDVARDALQQAAQIDEDLARLKSARDQRLRELGSTPDVQPSSAGFQAWRRAISAYEAVTADATSSAVEREAAAADLKQSSEALAQSISDAELSKDVAAVTEATLKAAELGEGAASLRGKARQDAGGAAVAGALDAMPAMQDAGAQLGNALAAGITSSTGAITSAAAAAGAAAAGAAQAGAAGAAAPGAGLNDSGAGPYRPNDPRSGAMQSSSAGALGPYRPDDPRAASMQSGAMDTERGRLVTAHNQAMQAQTAAHARYVEGKAIAEERYADNMAALERSMAKYRADVDKETNRQIADARKSHARQIEDIHRNSARQLANFERDLRDPRRTDPASLVREANERFGFGGRLNYDIARGGAEQAAVQAANARRSAIGKPQGEQDLIRAQGIQAVTNAIIAEAEAAARAGLISNDLATINSYVSRRFEELRGVVDGTTSSLVDLEDQLSAVEQALGRTLGRQLDLVTGGISQQRAAFDLRTTVLDSRALLTNQNLTPMARWELEAGNEEALASFVQSVQSSAMARAAAGEISPDDVQGIIVEQLQEAAALYPELAGSINERYLPALSQMTTEGQAATAQLDALSVSLQGLPQQTELLIQWKVEDEGFRIAQQQQDALTEAAIAHDRQMQDIQAAAGERMAEAEAEAAERAAAYKAEMDASIGYYAAKLAEAEAATQAAMDRIAALAGPPQQSMGDLGDSIWAVVDAATLGLDTTNTNARDSVSFADTARSLIQTAANNASVGWSNTLGWVMRLVGAGQAELASLAGQRPVTTGGNVQTPARPSIASTVRRMFFDEGGLVMPGMNLVENRSGRPEPVLTAGQWDRLLAALEALASSEDGDRPGQPSVQIGTIEATPEDRIADVAAKAQRALYNGRRP